MTYYKAFNKDMTCRYMQYEVGKVFCAQGKGEELCSNGVLHFCGNLQNLWCCSGYNEPDCRICEVEPLSEVHGSLIQAARCLRVVKDIGSWSDVIRSAIVGWIKIPAEDLEYSGPSLSKAPFWWLKMRLATEDRSFTKVAFPGDQYGTLIGMIPEIHKQILRWPQDHIVAPVFGSEWFRTVDVGFVMSPDGKLTIGSTTEGYEGNILDGRYVVYQTRWGAELEPTQRKDYPARLPKELVDDTVIIYPEECVFIWSEGKFAQLFKAQDTELESPATDK